MRILLVEDDLLLADGLAQVLLQSGYLVDIANDGSTADHWLENNTYDLVVLDLGLPGMDGREVLARLRHRKQNLPVLVLSARDAIDERVRLLDLGADDYVVKPIAASELEARARALIRRSHGISETTIQLGRLRLDTVGKRAWLGSEALELTAREWAALEFLSTRLNRIVSKEQMIQTLYTWEHEITPNAVEKFISRLRYKLEPAGIIIQTVRGLGYFMEKPVESPRDQSP